MSFLGLLLTRETHSFNCRLDLLAEETENAGSVRQQERT